MIFIWRGAGGVMILIGIIACLVINIVTSKIYDESNYFQTHLWPKLAALWVTGLCCFFLGRYLNSRPPRLLIDPATGQQVELKPIHDFMFIKLEYWGIILDVLGVVLLLFNLVR